MMLIIFILFLLAAITDTDLLIGCRLWHFVTCDKTEPTKIEMEFVEEFDERLKIWESTYRKILSCFINTSVRSIQNLIPRFWNAKID